MAIQNINLGTSPTGVGGDTLRSTAVKINENFNNSSHAASKLIGEDIGKVPLMLNDGLGGFGYGTGSPKTITNLADIVRTGFYQGVGANGNLNGQTLISPIRYGALFANRRYDTTFVLGLATDSLGVAAYTSGGSLLGEYNILSEKSAFLVGKTTADGANLSIDGEGNIRRSTSSERYKNILSPLTLDDTKYNEAMSLEPIVYRSTAEADNPDYHYYSFSAEALGSYDKAFTLWRNKETVTETKTDSEGNEYEDTKEVDLLKPVAEGLNINAILAFNHAISIKQDKLIKSLEKRIEDLEAINKGA